MKRGLQLGSFWLMLLTILSIAGLCAEPPAGSSIDNQAGASYEFANANATTTSNVVHVITQALEGVAIAENPTVHTPPGSSVPLPYLLTNTGNLTSLYTIAVVATSGDFTLQNLLIFVDTNHNGVIDPGDTPVVNGGTLTLPMGAFSNLLVSATVPTSARGGQQAQIRITATGAAQGVIASSVGTVIVALPDVKLAKSVATATARPGDSITYTLTATNDSGTEADGIPVVIDGASVRRLIVRDSMPANISFAAIVSNGGATPLYHRLGDPQDTYTNAAPTDPSSVDAIAFGLPSIANGTSYTFSFRVNIATSASGAIDNTAHTYFAAGTEGGPITRDSNTVRVTLPNVPPAISYYTNNTYNTPARVSRVDWPLFLQATAGSCNLDPTTTETRPISLTSKLTGDVESFTATETGPNTGLFRVLPDVPTRSAATSAVLSGNKILEVLPNDQVTAQLTGCGTTTVTAVIMIDPGGVVFDSHTNQPVAGATVQLIDVTGLGNGGRPGAPAVVFEPDGTTPASSSVTTSTDGRYQFPLVAPSTYKLVITAPNGYVFPSNVAPAQLPAGHNIDASGSYGSNFRLEGALPVFIDIPLDSGATAGLFLQKTASRTVAEIGDFVDYTLEIKNSTGVALRDVRIQDRLPLGFTYQLRSARRQGEAMLDPQGGQGPTLVFAIGDLEANGSATINYRLQIGPGARLGDGINRAQASASETQSNVASVRIRLQGGAFDSRGFIVGKIFADCDGDGLQDKGERGIPGVRVLLEDGTYVVSDDFGQYSFYGVSARTHVLKVDSYTLPAAVRLTALSSRNAGDSGSQFVTLHFGELFRADFAVSGCSAELNAAIEARRSKNEAAEADRALKENFQPERIAKTAEEIKGLPASGTVGADGGVAPVAPAPAASGAKLLPATKASSPDVTSQAVATTGPSSSKATASTATAGIDAAALDNALGFVGLKDRAVLAFAQTGVMVKGPQGASLRLSVNGKEISDKQVGRKTVAADKQLEVWEYVGVNLTAGENTLKLRALDQWGNPHGEMSLVVIAPDKLGKLKIETPKEAIADGMTPTRVLVRLTDSTGIPVTVRTPITLDASAGKWQVKDLDPKEPGTQVFVENGEAEFLLSPPSEPGRVLLTANSGGVTAESHIDYVPELRPMVAAGVIELGVDLTNGRPTTGRQNGFTEALSSMSASSADGTLRFGTRAAMLAKGRVPGGNLLTFSYDSDKSENERLFRDIQPDEYFPIYGDGGVRGYDAQSTSKMYVRMDHGKSYVQYGDFMTAEASTTQALSLGNYSRSLTGFKSHWEHSGLSVTGFTTHDSFRQVVVEIPANGTSGPYVLPYADGVENSEKVELLVRDRNQVLSVVKSTPLSRFNDYQFEPLTGRLLFKGPISTLDPDFNPQYIRVTYEVDQGGAKFWLGGARAQYRVNERLQFGGSFVMDQNPEDQNKLFSLNTTLKIAEKTNFVAEAAQTEHQLTGNGLGYRLEFNRETQTLQTKAYFGRTQEKFDNPVAFLNKGRGEAGAKLAYKLNGRTRLLGEFLRNEDVNLGQSRTGAFVGLERMLKKNIQAQFGFRYGHETASQAGLPEPGGTAQQNPTTNETIAAKVTMAVPHVERATVTAEFEQDVTKPEERMAAVGGSFRVLEGGKIYARHEFISSLGNMYTLNSTQTRNATVFGIETNYSKWAGARVFSEYRDRNELDSRQTEAAVGLRNRFTIRKGLTGTTGIESIRTLDGKMNNNSLAITGGLEYAASKNWRGSARMEWRGSTTTDTILNTAGFAARLNDNWTTLARNVIAVTTNKGESSGSRLQDRFQFGFAYRDTATNRFSALSMVELKLDSDDTQKLAKTKRQALVFTTVANQQIGRAVTLTGRYANKFVIDNSLGLRSTAFAQELGARTTRQLGKRWEISQSFNALLSNGFSTRTYAVGGEVGYVIMKNLSFATGYNVLGFNDKDLSTDEVTRRGPYLRLRFKFDENLFKGKGEK